MKLKIKLTNLPELNITHRIEEIADGVWFVRGILDDEYEFRGTVHKHYMMFSHGMKGVRFLISYQGEGASYDGKDFGILDVFFSELFSEQSYSPIEIKGGDGEFSFIALSKEVLHNMMDVEAAYLETYIPCAVME